jgi:hypothetical protein
MEYTFSRRQFIKNSALFSGAAVSLPLLPSFAADTNSPAAPVATTANPAPPATNVLTLDASARPAAASAAGFHMGTATAPGGHTLTLDSRSLLRDGKPWMLISGEFHYARCPEAEWHDELLKSKSTAAFNFRGIAVKSDRAVGGQTNCEFACLGHMTIARLAPDFRCNREVSIKMHLWTTYQSGEVALPV